MKTTKQLIASILLTVVAVFNLQGQNNAKTNLWKIEGDSIKTSYLFGTLHLLPEKDFVLKDKVKNAFDACDKVALEIDMADVGFGAEVMSNAFLKEGEELKSYLDENEYALLDTYLKDKTGVGMVNYNKFKPFMLMSVIMTASMEEKSASFELTFMQMTKDASKEMEGLETFADQVSIFENEPYDEQLDKFIEMIEDPDKTADAYQKLLGLYLAEDIDGMFDYMDDYMEGDLEAMKLFLDDRNNNWIPKFGEYSKDTSVFYAVGAGHLGGDQGVISLLKKAGYTVSPVLD
ncbi:TraB/GumN family protein [Psychroserpens sp. NJDZ02]|uniref:TraB/GumN family protein n=1 Tax=Psychroserpens sp. NJDZ02 TaxID=2570561 RepID=UPI0010A87D4B|nr:TraB/GumN family protein [Psychroserpens sp. NJDZ02]QCE41063.1 TraB/GumN family protein [Psychroserpens sp. NJDZ02]